MKYSASALSFLALAFTTSPCATTAFATPRTPQRALSTSTTITSLREGNSPFDALSGIGQTFSKEIGSLFKPKDSSPSETPEAEPAKPSFPDVVVEPDYKLGIIFLAGGFLLDLIPYIQLTLGPIVTLLGVLFVVQTARIRFTFDTDAFELRTSGIDEDGNLQKTGENIVVSGENRWPYDSFVNYAFFPEGWIDQPQGPILVYFKETQTPSEKWDEGPGKSANSEEAIAKGAKPGQVHFFPALCNTKQLRAEFEKRGCAKL